MLSESDFVVIAAPLTEETKRMIGKVELQAMKPTAYLVNIARGEIVDQDALIKVLKRGWIAGAGLDVFETEPLPTDNGLWKLPNAIISPHIAIWADMDRRSRRIIELFCENLRRYLAGEPLLNMVNKEKGY
jgi:phosphoglycerate dehydrogenase-like enzyme